MTTPDSKCCDCDGRRLARTFLFLAVLVVCSALYLITGDLSGIRVKGYPRVLSLLNVTALAETHRVIPSSENLRYLTYGSKMNCDQKPLSHDEENLKSLFEVEGKRFAYSWYAASDQYLCSALAAMRMLKDVRRNSSTHYLVDYVLTYVVTDFKTELSKSLLEFWQREGGVLRNFTSLKYLVKNNYYKASLQKFRAFQLTDYSRVVAMDADGMPLQDLDHLFRLKFPEGTHLASPHMYWSFLTGPAEGNSSGHTCKNDFVPVTSVMVVVEPDEYLYHRASVHFNTRRPNNKEMFDMDIINAEFSCQKNILVLPKHYGTLDSEYSHSAPLWKKVQECRNLSEVQYMHFTAGGKPWSHKRRNNKAFYESNYDEEVREVFKRWFDLARGTCPKFLPAFPEK